MNRPSPLQNRVTPFGDIRALRGRGMIMGNRGILHDERYRIVRPWQCRRWIACVIDFRGRRRTVMRPHSYTELFFLDEAAALSAGHRPCAECRRADYKRFQALWRQEIGGPCDAESMDRVLHADRLDRRIKRTYRTSLKTLPDGTFVVVNDLPALVLGDSLLLWSDAGYGRRLPRAPSRDVDVLTPRSIVALLRAGYRPAIHPSAP